MPLSKNEQSILKVASQLAYVNPFREERFRKEKSLFRLLKLKEQLPETGSLEDLKQPRGDHPSLVRLDRRLEKILKQLLEQPHQSLEYVDGKNPHKWVADAALYLLYRRHRHAFDELIDWPGGPCTEMPKVACWKEFSKDFRRFSPLMRRGFDTVDPGHIFACFFQIRRALMQIWRCIIGRSRPVIELRASVWESIFTVHPERFLTSLYRCLSAWPTLIIGPSGSGKGLVAQAIGLSRYCEFNKTMLTFPDYSPDGVYPVNLAATSTSRLEIDLFGSRRGSRDDPKGEFDGVLTRCGHAGTVFLDGINDADTPIQVKLLRVLETRRFLPVGETEERTFNGKIISASDRNLEEKVERGDFREDFYFRLCGDIIVTPSLREQLSDHPDDLTLLVRFILERELDCSITEDEKSVLTGEISDWINEHLGHRYHWPGNMRELEQCVRNILFHGKYRPMKRPPNSAIRRFLDSVASGAFDLEELKKGYATLIFALTGHKYSETGVRLDVDRRTVKKLIDWDLLGGFDADLGN